MTDAFFAAAFFTAFFRGVCASALAAAFRPAGPVFFFASARPAALAARGPVLAVRPDCASALAAADFAEGMVLRLLSALPAAEAASPPVRRSRRAVRFGFGAVSLGVVGSCSGVLTSQA